MAEIVKKEHVSKRTKAPAKPASTRTKTMFIIGIIIVLIPFITVAVIVLGDYLSGKKPITKNRYTNDLNPAIEKAQMESIKDGVAALSNVENVSVDLKTSTLRVYVDVNDTTSTESVEKVALETYKTVTSTLPANTYFEGSASAKMYDLEIHVYTVTDNEDANFDYYILTRNSNTELEEGYLVEHVSVAKDPELAAKLRGEIEEETSSDYNNPVDDSVEETQADSEE